MTGTIQHVDWTRGSGLATITMLTDEGDQTIVHVDAGPFFRAANDSGIEIGSRISYEVTDYGTMASFDVED